MRFRGGGIGHKAIWDALKTISKEQYELCDDSDNEDIDMDSGHVPNDDSDDDQQDKGSNDSTGENSDEDNSDGMNSDGNTSRTNNGLEGLDENFDASVLGAEDGEEGWEDMLDQEGYAPL